MFKWDLLSRNQATPPAKIIAAAVSTPVVPPEAVAVVVTVVLIHCRRLAYDDKVWRMKVQVTVVPD